MSDPIITCYISPYVSEQGQAPELVRDDAKFSMSDVAGICRSRKQKSGPQAASMVMSRVGRQGWSKARSLSSLEESHASSDYAPHAFHGVINRAESFCTRLIIYRPLTAQKVLRMLDGGDLLGVTFGGDGDKQGSAPIYFKHDPYMGKRPDLYKGTATICLRGARRREFPMACDVPKLEPSRRCVSL